LLVFHSMMAQVIVDVHRSILHFRLIVYESDRLLVVVAKEQER
jgi:hypothetical protein